MSRRSARRASASCATRRSRTTAATPGAAVWAPCWERSRSRRSRCARRRRSPPPTARRSWQPRATCARARSARRRRSTASSARSSNLLAFNAIATLPTRNFREATFEEAPRLAAEDLAAMRTVARENCASCTIGCEHIYATKGGEGVRVEYENVFALGPLCGIVDPDAVLAASARCDELGIDTISAGGTIAWAMECAERGLIDAPWLRFGDADALLRALDEIGARDRARRAAGRGLAPRGARRRAGLGGLRAPRQGPRAARATSRARCRRWRSASPSTRAAPTTTARAPTRPTSPDASTV